MGLDKKIILDTLRTAGVIHYEGGDCIPLVMSNLKKVNSRNEVVLGRLLLELIEDRQIYDKVTIDGLIFHLVTFRKIDPKLFLLFEKNCMRWQHRLESPKEYKLFMQTFFSPFNV